MSTYYIKTFCKTPASFFTEKTIIKFFLLISTYSKCDKTLENGANLVVLVSTLLIFSFNIFHFFKFINEFSLSGILAVDSGQMEAAPSLGLSKWSGMQLVVSSFQKKVFKQAIDLPMSKVNKFTIQKKLFHLVIMPNNS